MSESEVVREFATLRLMLEMEGQPVEVVKVKGNAITGTIWILILDGMMAVVGVMYWLGLGR